MTSIAIAERRGPAECRQNERQDVSVLTVMLSVALVGSALGVVASTHHVREGYARLQISNSSDGSYKSSTPSRYWKSTPGGATSH